MRLPVTEESLLALDLTSGRDAAHRATKGETQARTAASQLPSQRSEAVYRHGALTLLMCQWDKTAVKGGRGRDSVKLK